MDLKKSKRFTGIILKSGGYETEDVYDVGDGLYLNKCEIEQLNSPYRWLDMDSVEAGEIRKLLKQAKFNNK
jgi:hypothetical protein